jgi:hypothetical protein
VTDQPLDLEAIRRRDARYSQPWIDPPRRDRRELLREVDRLTAERDTALARLAAVEALHFHRIELWSGRSEDVVSWVDLCAALAQPDVTDSVEGASHG